MASLAHNQGDEHVVDGNPAGDYQPRTSYGRSKLANLLFALELHRRATSAGSTLTSTAAHPGVAVTNLVASREGMGSRWVVRTFAPRSCASSCPAPRAEQRRSCMPRRSPFPGLHGPAGARRGSRGVGPAKLSRLATDEDLARRLWTLSEELTGVTIAL